MTYGIPDGLVNLRDLGNLPTDDGGLTRSDVVYRSDAPHAGDQVPDEVEQWPPEVVVDFRDPAEYGPPSHPLSEVATVHRLPLLEDVRAQSGETEGWDSLAEIYRKMLGRSSEKLVEVFRIALEAEGAVLVHCAAGKDRTGVVSALLLGAASVRFDSIVADYVRTDRNMDRVLKRLDMEPELPPGVDERDVQELVSAPASAIEGVLARFAEYEHGAAGWLIAHGVTEAEIRRWRERFVVLP